MYKGFVFDMDGVMLLSEPFQLASFNAILSNHNVAIGDEEWYRDYAGYRDTVIASKIIEKYHIPLDATNCAETKRAAYLDFFKRGEVPPALGLIDAVKELSKNMVLGVASNASLSEIEAVTEGFGIRQYFKALTSGHEVEDGKPAPDVYLEAVRRLKLAPSECIALEDTPLGLTAANSAGLTTIAINTTHPSDDLRDADYRITSLTEIPTLVASL